MLIDKHELAYNLKSGGDKSILFIHGLGCSKDSFRHAFEGDYFPGEYTLLAPDMLGHGDSSKPNDFSYALEEQSSLIAELCQRLELRNPNIVAHSMGGAVALLLIGMLKQVNSFFCLEGNLVPEDCKISKRVSLLREKDFVNKFFPMAPLKFRCKGLASEAVTSPEAYYRSSKALVHLCEMGHLLEEFNNLPSKKTYIYGEENRKIKVLSKLGKQDVVQIRRCGHFMMMDNPKDTYEAIAKRVKIQHIYG